MLDSLYNNDILALAASLRNETLNAPDGQARKVSKLCGSELEIDLAIDGGMVTQCALRVKACALGQASAAILQQNIIGARMGDIKAARDALYAMLKTGGKAPRGRFEQLALLSAVKGYPARHISTLLAFDAALEAMQKIGPAQALQDQV